MGLFQPGLFQGGGLFQQDAAATTLTVQDTASASTSESPSLTQANVLVVQDSLSGSSSESPSLVQQNTLVVQDTASASSSESPALTQQNVLSVADTASASASDNVTISPDTTDTLLAVQDTLSASTSESPSLTQQNVLTVQDTLSASTSENVTLEDVQAPPVTPPAHDYDVAPQGVGRGLGEKRRRKIVAAIEESLEQPEPEIQKPKPKRTSKPTYVETDVHPTPTAEARAIEQPPERRPQAIEEPRQIELDLTERVPKRRAGKGSLRGLRHPAISAALAAAAGGAGTVVGSRRSPRTGSLEPYAVENPSPELMIALLTAA